jgi:hypothetical protein
LLRENNGHDPCFGSSLFQSARSDLCDGEAQTCMLTTDASEVARLLRTLHKRNKYSRS